MLVFPIASIPSFQIDTGRREFQLSYPGGDFVRFEGTLPDEIRANEDGTADVGILDIEIIERGNYLIGNAADELPQVSL